LMARLRKQPSQVLPPLRRASLLVLVRRMLVTAALSYTAVTKLFLRRLVVLRVGQVGRLTPLLLGAALTLIQQKYSLTPMRVAIRPLPATLAPAAAVHRICSATKALMAVHSQPGPRRKRIRLARPSRARESPALPPMPTSFSLVRKVPALPPSQTITTVCLKQ
jgi:hypothetical protein